MRKLIVISLIVMLSLTGCKSKKTLVDADTTEVAKSGIETFEYIENVKGEYIVNKYIGESTDVVFPEGVVQIKSKVFNDMASRGKIVTSVKLPSTLKRIDKRAFKNLKLSEIDLPEGLETIGEFAFDHNYIAQLKIPDSVEDIGRSAFSNNNLKSIEIGSGLYNMGKYLDFLGGVSEDTKKLRQNSSNPFHGNHGLRGIKVSEDNDRFVTDGNSIYSKDWKILYTGTSQTVIKEGTEEIVGYAMTGLNISSVEIPEGVQIIGHNSFSYNNISEVKLPLSITKISDSAFSNNPIIKLQIPAGIKIPSEKPYLIDRPLYESAEGTRYNLVLLEDSIDGYDIFEKEQ